MTPAQRAQKIAETAAKRFDTQHIAKEWFTVQRSGEPAFEVFMCPPATHAEMLKRYLGAGVVAK